jgi:tetratricopeptide (TPR) repeat protein
MTPSQQFILKIASTIGNQFTPIMIFAIIMSQGTETSKMMMKMDDILKDLKAIELLGLVAIVKPPPKGRKADEALYGFVNTLIKDVVYNLMLFSQRRQIHAKIAAYYLDTYPGNSAYYPLLAYHYKQADDYKDDALNYYTKAGSTSLSSFSNKEAVMFFQEALQIAGKIRTVPNLDDITMERKLGQAFYNLGQFDKAGTQFKKALEFLGLPITDEDAANKRKTSQLIKKIGTHSFNPEENRKSKKEEADPAEKAQRVREAVISLLGLARVSIYALNRATATTCVSLALTIAPSTGAALDGESNAMACFTAGLAGDHQAAENYIAKGRELAGKLTDIQKVVDHMAGLYYCGIAKWDKAEEVLNKAVKAAQTVGDLRTYEECMLHLGTVYYFKGELKRAITATEEALESSSRRGDPQTQIASLVALGRNFYAKGDYVQVLNCIEEAKVNLDAVGLSDISTEVQYFGLAALMNLRQHKTDNFWFFSEAGYSILSRTEPILYSTYFGYNWLTECYMHIIQDYKSFESTKLPLSKTKLVSKVEKAQGFLKKFSETFPFAVPSTLFWRGCSFAANGKKKDAKQYLL